MQPPKESNPNVLFVQTDISSWEQQAELFQKAYAWGKRLDFCALNAGIDDRDNIFNTLSYDLNNPPSQPNTAVFSVNVIGTYVKPDLPFQPVSHSSRTAINWDYLTKLWTPIIQILWCETCGSLYDLTISSGGWQAKARRQDRDHRFGGRHFPSSRHPPVHGE